MEASIIEECREMYEEAKAIIQVDVELEAILVIACVCKLPPTNNLSTGYTTDGMPRPEDEAEIDRDR